MDLSPSLLSSLKRLRLFHELSPNQIKRIFAICRQRSLLAGEVLCKAGAESDRMYVILTGTIEVISPNGTELAREEGVTTTGETGVLSGEVRSATVRVVDPVTALEIERLPLLRIMQDDGGLAVRLYRNAMILVREKLMAADRRLEEALARLATVGPEEKGA
ncbi:MAG: cyclic nucleotide-binding domain-containing protein [Gemmatimonadota bacterium]